MSTRCQIVILEPNGELYPVKIYKHCDGYPEGVMPILAPFAIAFADNRGSDPEYFIAQCCRAFAFKDLARSQAEADGPYRHNPRKQFTGWGCSTFWHGDIEYLYVVSAAGSVKILAVDVPSDWPEDKIPPGKEVAWPAEDSEEEE